jgi:predicted metalloprotease with PDZ domain
MSSCASTQKATTGGKSGQVAVTIDLINVLDDKVKVIVKPVAITSQTAIFRVPRIIPGTYMIADYGRYIEKFEAFDNSGKSLPVAQQDVNTWVVSSAVQLDRVTYLVNDTFDSEMGSAFSDDGSNTIFSPAGTNILAGKQFYLNMAGFVGYFENQVNTPYHVAISHPSDLVGTSSMDDEDKSAANDVFQVSRYAELIDSPVMYSNPDVSSFTVDNLKVVLHVYSPLNKEITSASLMPEIQKMIVAQKKFLGDINNTPKYAILTYITTYGKDDARGIGALEHNKSTTAVFMQTMSSNDLIQVISHEFFHTLTPLNIHSKEIHDFDFNNPKMSAHLWMYEGVTEYFANLFQVNQGLISEDEFLAHMAEKESLASKLYPREVSFTEMSKNVLDPEMQEIYPNVYQKGALLAMCIDLIIRDKSNGQKGILDLMRQLSNMYGPAKPFDDAELIPMVTKLTYPEVGDFIQKYIVEGAPIDYAKFLALAGIERATIQRPVQIALLVDNKPYLRIDKANNRVLAVVPDDKNEFVNAMGLQDNDVIVEINGQKLDISNMVTVLGGLYNLEEGRPMLIKVQRNGEMMDLKGNAKLNHVDTPGFKFADASKQAIKESWLKR